MLQLTIDGKQIKAPEGTTILQAAKENGIEIPTLCYHEALEPWGACRLCIVEVVENGRSRIVTSCNFPIKDDLTVKTRSKTVVDARRMVIELLLARCPNAKAVREMAQKLGVREPRFTLENEFCILCGLCVRVCREIVGANAITFANRGKARRVSSPFFVHADACIGCGACVYICPTDCITMDDVKVTKDIYPDEREISGYTRIMNNWRTRLKLKTCKLCGNPFAPEIQLNTLGERVNLPPEFFDTCQACKTI